MIEAVLFDIDGTLIDSNTLHVDAWAEVFADAGHDVPRAAIAGQIGKGGDNLVPSLLPDSDEAERARLDEAHGDVFKARYIERARPFPDAAALLRRVAADGRKVVLASSASAAELDHYVELLGIGDIVAARTSSDDVATTKPAPDIFAVALKKAGVQGDRAVAVGDTPYDVTSAAGAGTNTVALLSGGFAQDVLREAGAIAIYADVATLLADYEASPLAR
ncbi:HAD family hydrolase [Sphingomonas sp.]|jgi:membrane protein|uniref:HAD family hydrolase n=1 Tax=Sphingomonas sp. TaxID=28214 RepID=UPI002ED84E84